MSFLLRAVDPERWLVDGFDGEVPAEAVLGILRPKKNELSFWRAGDDLRSWGTSLMHAATAAAACFTSVEATYFAVVPVAEFAGIRLDDKPSEACSIARLRSLHVDACNLDIRRYAQVAHAVGQCIHNDKLLSLSADHVKELLAQAVRSRLIAADNLKGGVKGEVKEWLIEHPSADYPF